MARTNYVLRDYFPLGYRYKYFIVRKLYIEKMMMKPGFIITHYASVDSSALVPSLQVDDMLTYSHTLF
jgi:hypothetical protein